jgi:hypothetical protein
VIVALVFLAQVSREIDRKGKPPATSPDHRPEGRVRSQGTATPFFPITFRNSPSMA